VLGFLHPLHEALLPQRQLPSSLIAHRHALGMRLIAAARASSHQLSVGRTGLPESLHSARPIFSLGQALARGTCKSTTLPKPVRVPRTREQEECNYLILKEKFIWCPGEDS